MSYRPTRKQRRRSWSLPGARPTKSLEAPCGRHQCKGWRPIRLRRIPTPRRCSRPGARVLLLPFGVGVLRFPRPRWRGDFRRRPLSQVQRYGPDTLLARSDQPAGWGRDRSERLSGRPVSLPIVHPRLLFYGLSRDAPGAEAGYRRPVGAAQDQHVGV